MENKTLEELDNLENDYIARHWDTRGRHESDMELNDIARAKIAAVKRRIIYANQNIPGYIGTPIREIMESAF